MCVCVCVCVCEIYIYIYIRGQSSDSMLIGRLTATHNDSLTSNLAEDEIGANQHLQQPVQGDDAAGNWTDGQRHSTEIGVEWSESETRKIGGM